MCLDNPSAAQKEEFQFEIEQMKQLGSHPNVVSLVGCCTLQDEKFLVIEYVPFGDLLTWLRCRRNRVRKWRKFYNVLWTRVTEEKKEKDTPLKKHEGIFPVFPFFDCKILSIFASFHPYFSHFPPYYSTRLPPFPLPPAPHSPGFAPQLSSSIFSSQFSFRNAMELEALAWTHLLITSTFCCVNKIWRYT